MPTTRVDAGSEALLQEIANSIWKARKIVVVTGAGISTNSGIPDFRSENGLYSMIQAQFDSSAKQTVSKAQAQPDVANAVVASRSDRPAKRQKMSPEPQDSIEVMTSHAREIEASSPRFVEEEEEEEEEEDGGLSSSVNQAKETRGQLEQLFLGQTPGSLKKEVAKGDGENPHSVIPKSPGASLRSSPRLPAFALSGSDGEDTPPRPPGTPKVHQSSTTTPSSSPPSTPQPDSGSMPAQVSLNTSPLSSPPPDLFDPYNQPLDESSSATTSTPSSPASATRTSPPPSQFDFSSQGSTLSRSSLPNLKGRDLFDASIWSDPLKTSVFYTFTTTLRQKSKDAAPTSCHYFLGHLRDCGKLVRCYTQNIDQMEEKVGLASQISLGPGSRGRFSTRSSRPSATTSSGAKHDPHHDPAEHHDQPCSARVGAGSSQTSNGPTIVGSTTTGEDLVRGSSERGRGTASGSLGDNRAVDRDDDRTPGSSGPSTSAHLATGPKAKPGLDTLSDSRAASSQSQVPLSEEVISTESSQLATPPSPNRGVECVYLHGSLHALRCFQCGRTTDWDEGDRELETMSGRQPPCPHCEGATVARQERGKRALGVGKLRPDIVLYGEDHPHADLISPIVTHDLSLGPDLFLILGTSLKVHGLKRIVKEFAKAVHNRGGKVVFVNFTKPPDSVWADTIDFWVELDCDAWVHDLKARKQSLFLPPGSIIEEEEKPKTKRVEKLKSAANTKPEERKVKTVEKAKAKKLSQQNTNKNEKSKFTKPEQARVEQIEEPKITKPQRLKAKKIETAATKAEVAKVKRVEQQKVTKLEQPKITKSEPKRPVSIRDHRTNAAYLTLNILSSLARISGRDIDPKPPPVTHYPYSTLIAPTPTKATTPLMETSRADKISTSTTITFASTNPPDPKPRGPRVKNARSRKRISEDTEMADAPKAKKPQRPKPNLQVDVQKSSSLGINTKNLALPNLQPERLDENSILAAVKSNPRTRKPKVKFGEEGISWAPSRGTSAAATVAVRKVLPESNPSIPKKALTKEVKAVRKARPNPSGDIKENAQQKVAATLNFSEARLCPATHFADNTKPLAAIMSLPMPQYTSPPVPGRNPFSRPASFSSAHRPFFASTYSPEVVLPALKDSPRDIARYRSDVSTRLKPMEPKPILTGPLAPSSANAMGRSPPGPWRSADPFRLDDPLIKHMRRISAEMNIAHGPLQDGNAVINPLDSSPTMQMHLVDTAMGLNGMIGHRPRRSVAER